jgi:hypothetical protein
MGKVSEMMESEKELEEEEGPVKGIWVGGDWLENGGGSGVEIWAEEKGKVFDADEDRGRLGSWWWLRGVGSHDVGHRLWYYENLISVFRLF